MRHSVFFFCFLGVVLAVQAQVTIHTQLDTAQLLIGDHIPLEVTVTHDPDIAINQVILSVEDSLGVEVLEESALLRVHDSLVQKRFLLTAFDSGYYRLPPLQVLFEQEGVSRVIEGASISFAVATLPVPPDSAVLQPIKPILSEPITTEDLLPFLIGILLLGAMGLVGWWIIKGKKKEKQIEEVPIVQVPAHELALQKLRGLQAEKAWEEMTVKAYYVEVTHVLRSYLENQFGVDALELTTSELRARLSRSNSELKEELKPQLFQLLQQADLVKFAKAAPELSSRKTFIEAAIAWVSETAIENVQVETEENQVES